MISKHDFEDILSLSRLNLNDKEKEQIFNDFKQIIDYMQEINQVDVSNEKPFLSLGKNSYLREDIVKDRDFSRDIFLENIPDREKDFVKIPPILKEDSFEL